MSGYGKNWQPTEHYKNASIADDYDKQRFSSLAGRLFNALEKKRVRRAFRGMPKGSALIDVPCGTGRLAEVLLQEGFKVSGFDISEQMLTVARRKLRTFGSKFDAKVLDARRLPETGLRFEGALCARVLMHFPFPEQVEFLRAVGTVTNRRVVFTQGLDTPFHRVRRALKRVLRTQAPAVFPLTRSELKDLIRQAGLREIRRYHVLPMLSESVVVVTEPVSESRR